MNAPAQSAAASTSVRLLRRWTGASVLLGLCVVALLSWLHFEQRETLRHASDHIYTLRVAEGELAKGFLQISLADDSTSPFSRTEGVAWLQQSVRSFEHSLEYFAASDATEVERFRRSMAAFIGQLEAWRRSPASDPQAMVALRVAYGQLEQQVAAVDNAAQRHFAAQSAGSDRIYAYSLAGSLLALGSIIGIVINIARRERSAVARQAASAQAQLKSEERFRRLFDNAPVAMGHVGGDGVILARNARFEQVFGYADADIVVIDDWWRLAFPDPDARVRAQVIWNEAVARASVEGPEIDAGEFRAMCKDGVERIVRASGILLQDGVLAALTDVTEHRQAESRLRLWAESFEQAELGLAISDARTNSLIAVNPAFARERGFEREEMIGMPVIALFPEERRAEARNAIAQADVDSHAVFESEHMRKYGTRFPVLLDITVLRGPDGRPANRVAYALDLTQRRRAEQALVAAQNAALEQQREARLAALNQMEDANAARANAEAALAALRESEQQLQLFIEHAPAELAMFDRDMRYLSASRRWLDTYVPDGREVLGRSHYDVVPGLSEEWKEAHRRGLAGEVLRADEDRFLRADGSLMWLRWEILPWRKADGSVGGIVIFAEDISGYKLAEEEIRQLNAGLEQRVIERTAELSAANQELDSFAYAVSHDLRAPLRAMNGFSQALAEDYGERLDGEAKGYLDQIGIASRKMSALIDGMLVLSRCTRGELRRDPVDLSALATRLLNDLARADPDRQVKWSVEPGLNSIGDTGMIEVVMANLMENAWKYTGKAGQPEIRVYRGEVGGCPGVCIADNGAGFDMTHAQRLFKPFQRLHRQDEFPGIGIGLATVQRIVNRHGGEIVARGEPGQGAVFCFNLPSAPTGEQVN